VPNTCWNPAVCASSAELSTAVNNNTIIIILITAPMLSHEIVVSIVVRWPASNEAALHTH